ncbi:MAG: hypothetical protein KAI17_25180 [Thiotrichaceae bacterium]|nr:hypothetical protein [Thiotrichaceae bacterium]
MKRKELKHAEKIVTHFKNLLSDKDITEIGDAHFDELSLMIEAAINASVLTVQERTADKVAKMAEEIRHGAESGS